MLDTDRHMIRPPRTAFPMHHEPGTHRDGGVASVEYGILIAVFGAAVIGVLLSLGDQLVQVFGIIVDAATDPRNPTTVVGMAWPW